jgi:AbrB family looped-hinge helix DNA binding protein
MIIKNIKIKSNRIWLPKSLQSTFRSHFLEVELRKQNKKQKFFTRITKDGRFVIPKEIRESLELKNNDKLWIKIRIILNNKFKRDFFQDDKVDVLAFVPAETMSGFDILTLEKNRKLSIWYSTKGRPNEIEVNRFLPISFLKLLGYYQAEGGKPKLQKRRGRELSFTNKSLFIIKDFIKLSRSMFKTDLWKILIRYNSKVPKNEIDNLKLELTNSGINPNNINSQTAERISHYTIRLWISNSLLFEILFNMMNKIRKYLVSSGFNHSNRKLCVLFTQGLLAGDGTFHYWIDKKGSLHSNISIFEANEDYMKDYQLLLNKFQIYGNFKKHPTKNFYIYSVFTNWNSLLTLWGLKLLICPHHRESLKKTILRHKRYRSMRYLKFLPDEFTTSWFRKTFDVSYPYTMGYLRDRMNENILLKVGLKNNENMWKLTNYGKIIKNIISTL